MTTEKLYLEDARLREFEAKIVKTMYYENDFAVVLDKTAFYPTSGGQMHDTGTINGVRVLNVIENDSGVLHILSEPIFEKNAKCQINWDRRFDFMQQHTAFHILAQSFLRINGKNTLSSHLGEEISTIDIETSQISDQEIEQAENLANQICYENRVVRQFFVEENDLGKFDLRAKPTKGEKIRLVEIENFDIDPCAGTHVSATGEVGIIKILSQEKIRGNVRLSFVAGKRALENYRKKWKILKQLSANLTEAEEKLNERIAKLLTEQKELLKTKKKYFEILLEKEAADLIQEIRRSESQVLRKIFQNRELTDIRNLARKIIQNETAVLVFGLMSERSHLIVARSQGIEIDLRQKAPQISEILNCKGGGRPDFVEFGGIEPEILEKNLSGICKLLK